MRRILLAAALTLTAATAQAQQWGFSPFNQGFGYTGTSRSNGFGTYRHYGNTGGFNGFSRQNQLGNSFRNFGSNGMWQGSSTFNFSGTRLNHYGTTGLRQGYSRFSNGRLQHYSNTGLPLGYSRVR